VCRSAVVNILKEEGLDPSPERRKGTWAEFVRRHAATLWVSDFVGVKTWTRKGAVDLYLLFFLHVESRRVFVGGITAHPDAEWVTRQARNSSTQFTEWGLPCTHLLIDHDTKNVAGFDVVLAADGTEVKRVGPMAPNLNAYAERWVQSLRHERLDRFVVLGESHLRHLVSEYLAHYNHERSHQEKGNAPLGDSPPVTDALPCDEAVEGSVLLPFPARVECRERLGSLLKHYRRAA
jgi:putative transposase